MWNTTKDGGQHVVTTKNSFILESGTLEWKQNKFFVELL